MIKFWLKKNLVVLNGEWNWLKKGDSMNKTIHIRVVEDYYIDVDGNSEAECEDEAWEIFESDNIESDIVNDLEGEE